MLSPRDRVEIGRHAHSWHGGQWSGLYAVGSCLVANVTVLEADVDCAIGEATRLMQRAGTYGQAKEMRDLAKLISELRRVKNHAN